MILTNGEKMVWAAAFVHDFVPRLQEPPAWATKDHNEWEKYEVGIAQSAAEVSCAAVVRMRDAAKEEIGGEHVDAMLRAMLGDEG